MSKPEVPFPIKKQNVYFPIPLTNAFLYDKMYVYTNACAKIKLFRLLPAVRPCNMHSGVAAFREECFSGIDKGPKGSAKSHFA